MPKSQKPIVCICGSRNLTTVNIDRYIDASHIGAIVTGGAVGIDTLAEQWAKKNKKEWVCYLPRYDLYGKKAPLMRDKDMVDFCDVVIAFWNGKSTGTKYTLDYAMSLGRKCIVHLFQELD